MEQQSENIGSRDGSKTLWIIGGIILAVMIVGLVYGATQKSLRNANSAADATKTLQLNGSSASTTSATAAGNSVLGASETVPLPVTIKGLDVVNLETLPQQVQAKVSYSLAGDCAVADTPSLAQSGKTFTVTMASHAPKGASCSSDAVAGSAVVSIPVDGLAPGTYVVKVGGVSRSFVLKPDNEISSPISK